MDQLVVKNLNGDGCLSFKEIYKRSKKEDDYEKKSMRYTSYLSQRMWIKKSFLDTKENKVRACKLLWCGIKIGFYLNPTSRYMTWSLRFIGAILNMRDPEFNQEFKRWRDYEVLNYKDPDEAQAEVIKTLKFYLGVA